MKIRYTVILIVLGMISIIAGAFIKILHYPSADDLLFIGSVLEICGWSLFFFKVVKNLMVKRAVE